MCKDNQLELARQFFKEMEAHGLTPNVITWNSLLDGMCKNGQIDEAITMMQQMENSGVVPNIVTYSILMDGLCNAKRLREAVEIFSVLTTKGLHDVRAYTIMIKGFCKEGLLAKADELLKNMEDNKCFPNECTFNTIIRGFIDGKDVRRALELVSLMRNKEFAADNHTISSLVSLLTDPNISGADKDLLKKFLRTELARFWSKGKNLNACGRSDYNTDRLAFDSSGQLLSNFQYREETRTVIGKKIIEGYTLTVITLSSLMRDLKNAVNESLCEARCLNEAVDIFTSLATKCLQPDVVWSRTAGGSHSAHCTKSTTSLCMTIQFSIIMTLNSLTATLKA
ncbi:pentatricopeptide repeat-containing protein At1g62930, chloroplastic-like [Chenopodium quinoa]|uniref:pentatricopeptide repeat-containing protein At1g62930, chloroplastic-like n=1 Tax=Chenopodium quinoa TaxID=63459 RepID=UPI000B792CFC|nr:pentatricopeptide repeat-containing protein At1g62930, chloroplastic-like [Chenopodium quinoa]